MRKALLAIAAILSVGAAAPGFIQGTGQLPASEATIGRILADPVRDQMVRISGEVVQHVGDNVYLVNDGTGRVAVDGGPPWHSKLRLPIGSEVTVTGEVGLGPPWLKKPRTPEIDIFSVVLPDGTRKTVRARQGPPPWAGGPPSAGGKERGQAAAPRKSS
jgi:uncharacterized protein YdeI (BOF family)